MLLLVGSMAAAAFLIGFHLAGVVPAASRALVTARTASEVMRNPALHDDDKELAVRNEPESRCSAAYSRSC